MKLRPQFLALLFSVLSVSAWAAEQGVFGFDISVDADGFFLNPILKSVTVEKVVPNSPAAKAGLKPGDVILEVEGHTVSGTRANVVKPYLEREVGQTTRMTVRKPNGEIVPVILVAAPKAEVY